MSEYPDIAARFARETAKHQMTVLHDDGLYRHLKFMSPGHGSFGAFHLITWPYNLVAKTGWTFHFDIDATEDTFDLFRRTALPGEINPGYWQEKVRAGRDEIYGYSMDLLKKEIKDSKRQWIRDDLDNRITKLAKELGFDEAKVTDDMRKRLAEQVEPEWNAYKRQLRKAVHDHFFSDDAEYNVEYESEAHRALNDFSFRPEGDDSEYPHYFADWHEWRLSKFSHGFLHTCHAIRHGIDLYEASRKQVAA
jgi:hypothetical protein